MANHGDTAADEAPFNQASEQVGALYARALFGALESANQTDAVLAEFDSFLTDVLDGQPQFDAVLSSGRVSHDRRERLLDKVLSGRASNLFLNFLKVLSSHDRLGSIRAVNRALHKIVNAHKGRVEVRVTTAQPLSDQQTARIADSLRSRLNAEPVLIPIADPDLLGGVVLKIGDTVYDGSVSTQLETIRGQIIQRSVHEIQSRRDRFCHSAGD